MSETTAEVTQERVDNLEALVVGLDRLLACYRTGSQPPGALLDRIAECRRRRSAFGGPT